MKAQLDPVNRPQPWNMAAAALVAVFFALCCLVPGTASAKQWTATQGDILSIDLPATGKHVQVRAFGKTWPWKRLDADTVHAWIGIDLKTKPGWHSIHVRSKAGRKTEHVRVMRGHFRISRITVKKKMAVFDSATLKRIRSDQASIHKAYTIPVSAHPDITISEQPVEGVISTPFGAQRFVNGEPRSPHMGLDIAAPEGTPIITPLPGRVLLASPMYLNGNTVVIGYGNGLDMVYSHLKKLRVKVGDWLKQGQQIGEVGMTGRATGPHLHWGVSFRQARVNPLALLSANPVASGQPTHQEGKADK